jgi:hypothetical protein
VFHLKRSLPQKHLHAVEKYVNSNKDVFGEVLHSDAKVVVRGFNFKSYGYLRKLVDKLNGV